MRTTKFKGWMQESLRGKGQSEEWRGKHELDRAEVPSLWAGAMKTRGWAAVCSVLNGVIVGYQSGVRMCVCCGGME